MNAQAWGARLGHFPLVGIADAACSSEVFGWEGGTYPLALLALSFTLCSQGVLGLCPSVTGQGEAGGF